MGFWGVRDRHARLSSAASQARTAAAELQKNAEKCSKMGGGTHSPIRAEVTYVDTPAGGIEWKPTVRLLHFQTTSPSRRGLEHWDHGRAPNKSWAGRHDWVAREPEVEQ